MEVMCTCIDDGHLHSGTAGGERCSTYSRYWSCCYVLTDAGRETSSNQVSKGGRGAVHSESCGGIVAEGYDVLREAGAGDIRGGCPLKTSGCGHYTAGMIRCCN